MVFYNQSVENEIKKLHFTPNSLEAYDNVTYNVRFYMLHPDIEFIALPKEREFKRNVSIKNENKIIIFETGKSTNYSLTSLILKTYYVEKGSLHNCLTTEIKMKLKELYDCSLTNKIAVVSKMLGYDSYVGNPYHLDIWFSGYDHITKKPVQVIDNMVYTYDVYVNTVQSHVDDTGTEYNFVLNPTYHMALNKYDDIILDNGIIKLNTGTMDELKNFIQKSANDKYFSNNPELDKVYNRDFITINIKDFSQTKLDDVYNYNGSLVKVEEDNPKTISFYKDTSNKASGNIPLEFKGDKTITLDNVFQHICLASPDYKNCVAISTYRAVPFKNYNNKQLYKVYMDVVIMQEPYLKWWNETYGATRYSNDELFKFSVENMQKESLKLMKIHKTLEKKYQYCFNGEDTNVLELHSKIDNLWFLNIGTNNLKNAVVGNKEVIKTSDTEKEKTFDEIIEEVKGKYKKLSSLSSDKMIYIDDVYNAMNNLQKIDLLSNRPIAMGNDTLNGNTVNIQLNKDNMLDYEVANVGYTNLFKSNNLIQIEFTILGDPYWLYIPSQNSAYSNGQFPEQSLLYHFYFNLKTSINPDNVSHTGGYSTLNAKDFTGIYQIIESTSIFSDGKFTQKINGVIDDRFIHSTLVKA